MSFLHSFTWPLAMLSFSLLFTPLNQGNISYILSSVLSISVGISVWLHYKIQEKKIMQSKEVIATENEQAQSLINLQQQTVQENQKSNEEFKKIATKFKVLSEQQNEQFKLISTIRNSFESQWKDEKARCIQHEEQAETRHKDLIKQLVAFEKRVQTAVETSSENQNVMWKEQTANNETRFGQIIEGQLKQIFASQDIKQELINQQNPLIEQMDEANSQIKKVTKQLEDMFEASEDQSSRQLSIIGDTAENFEEILEGYTDEISEYKVSVEHINTTILSMTKLLDERYLPVVEKCEGIVQQLQETANSFGQAIDEIASSKLEERKKALEMQQDILEQLKI